jgi:type VI secretion system secreted protein Hcp
MAVDMFLKLSNGIKGEAKDKEFTDQIDVLSFSWGLSQTGTTHVGSGGTAGRVTAMDIHVVKYLDKSSPDLFLACCNGTHIDTGNLICRKSAGKGAALQYLKIDFDELIVTSVNTQNGGGDERQSESVSFNFRKFKLKYTMQDDKGKPAASPDITWDLALNSDS